jgi:hypothetical protein
MFKYREITSRESNFMCDAVEQIVTPHDAEYKATLETLKKWERELSARRTHQAWVEKGEPDMLPVKESDLIDPSAHLMDLDELEKGVQQLRSKVSNLEYQLGIEEDQVTFHAGQIDGFRLCAAYMAHCFQENPSGLVSVITALSSYQGTADLVRTLSEAAPVEGGDR